MDVQTEIKEITPQEAEALLEVNKDNRNLRMNTMRRYARDMQGGKWSLNGESIKIAADGTLLDGQHRLLGCVEAGVPFTTIVITGLPNAARETVDTGSKRSFGDVLKWRGEVNCSALAAAVECGLTWDEQGWPRSLSKHQHSNAERVAWLEANPDIRLAVSKARPFARTPFSFPVSASAVFILRIERISPDEADAFLKGLASGANLDENDPIVRLRAWMFNVNALRGTRRRWEYAAFAVKAWNAWIEGREVRQLTWKRGGSQREDFPMLVTPDGRTYEAIITDPKYVPPGLVKPGEERMGFTRQAKSEGLPATAVGA